jgi:hypothetical protein
MNDVAARIEHWLNYDDQADLDELLNDAQKEIERLTIEDEERAAIKTALFWLKWQRDSAHDADDKELVSKLDETQNSLQNLLEHTK